MALLQILHYPDPRLRTIAKPVSMFGEDVLRIVADMFETMYAAPGIGLAATQVNIARRIVVTDTSRDGTDPRCFINPQIIELRGVEQMEEGCLSVPDVFETVERAEWVKVQAFDQHGTPFRDGTVTMPPGWTESYRDWAAAGWGSWPAYRVSNGQFWTMQHRLNDCYRQQRFPEPVYGSDVTIALSVFLAGNGNGGTVLTPGMKR